LIPEEFKSTGEGDQLKPALAIFDLDGTLVDSKRDLANAVNATRAYMGRGPLPNDLIYSYVGNGVSVLVRRALGSETSEPDFQKALAYFLSWYRDHALVHTCLYAGVLESLERLRSARVRLAVLTNKPTDTSCAILKRLGVSQYFFRVYGGDSFHEKKPDPVGINALLAESRVPRSVTVLVGDSAVDVRTARNAEIPIYGVSYGFAPQSLIADPPDLLFDSMLGVVECLLEDDALVPRTPSESRTGR
jgi:phosphoglycolate phosphatase